MSRVTRWGRKAVVATGMTAVLGLGGVATPAFAHHQSNDNKTTQANRGGEHQSNENTTKQTNKGGKHQSNKNETEQSNEDGNNQSNSNSTTQSNDSD